MNWKEQESQAYLYWVPTHQHHFRFQTPTYLTHLFHFWEPQPPRVRPRPHPTSSSRSDQMCRESPLQHIRPALFSYPTPPFWLRFRNAQEQQPVTKAYHLTFSNLISDARIALEKKYEFKKQVVWKHNHVVGSYSAVGCSIHWLIIIPGRTHDSIDLL